MTIIYFVLILGLIIFVHELGHFTFAKLFKIYVHEFSLGMGPRIWSKKKGETEYSLRLFPIGGFVTIAGEDDTEDAKVKEDQKLTSKSILKRFIVMAAGATFNFIFAIIIIFTLALFLGSVTTKPYIGEAMKDYPASTAGIAAGELVLSVDGTNVYSYDDLTMELYENGKNDTTFKVEKKNGDIVTYKVTPKEEKGNYYYGIRPSTTREYGFIKAVNYTSYKFVSLIRTMGRSLLSLVTGELSIQNFAGPIGVYGMVDEHVASGFDSIAFFVAYLCINIGFINLLPLPALDGGRILFLIIEIIKGSKVSLRVESIVHTVGFMLLMGLLLIVTFNDLFRLGGS